LNNRNSRFIRHTAETWRIGDLLKWCIAYVPTLIVVVGYLLESSRRHFMGIGDDEFIFNSSVTSGLLLGQAVLQDLVQFIECWSWLFISTAIAGVVGTYYVHKNGIQISRLSSLTFAIRLTHIVKIPLFASMLILVLSTWKMWTFDWPALSLANIIETTPAQVKANPVWTLLVCSTVRYGEGGSSAKTESGSQMPVANKPNGGPNGTDPTKGVFCDKNTHLNVYKNNLKIILQDVAVASIFTILVGFFVIANAKTNSRIDRLCRYLAYWLGFWTLLSLPLAYGRIVFPPAPSHVRIFARTHLAELYYEFTPNSNGKSAVAATPSAENTDGEADSFEAYVVSKTDTVMTILMKSRISDCDIPVDNPIGSSVKNVKRGSKNNSKENDASGRALTTPRYEWRQFELSRDEIILVQPIQSTTTFLETYLRTPVSCPIPGTDRPLSL
jgi:hypothetical protein